MDSISSLLSSFHKIKTRYYLYSFKNPDKRLFSTIKKVSSSAFAIATTQEAKYCAGHTDSISLSDPENGWGWILNQGFNAICTDNPSELLVYLKSKGLHD